jgi:hypothetical protein
MEAVTIGLFDGLTEQQVGCKTCSSSVNFSILSVLGYDFLVAEKNTKIKYPKN